ncbi:class I adenylate-forming enzyme family protein [Brevibacterium sp. RIT 803]|uniref:class I adenylate-forming enzyme family protein n=1 Tax=Brevibacterium sp. RIT 803 TaxID=2810210 RepID=UPI001950D615|nr:class I adenylate-forming enzyme family protein [Brevibacterium sp. RIT 803]MBM6588869.1 acyl--CoA ligase [Brevibacterium sp. RIT 803]
MTTEYLTLSRRLSESLARHAGSGRTAFSSTDAEVTYADLRDTIAGAQSRFSCLRLNRGDRVGLVVDKTAESIAAFIGLILMGACPAFIDPRSSTSLLREQCEIVGLKSLVCEPERYDELAAVSDMVVSTGELGAQQSIELIVADVVASDKALLLFTSGSTGRPKGAVLSHSAVATHAASLIERTSLSDHDVLLHLMPIFHTNGVNNQIIAPLIAGARVVLEEKFRPKLAVEALRRTEPTIVTGVPTMFLRMLPYVQPNDEFENLRMIRCGSAPIKTEQVKDIEAAFGVPVVLSYGMSEATCTSTMNPPERRKAGSVGTVLAGQTIRIAKPGSLDPVAEGRDGEVLIGGDTLMAEYLGADGADPIENGWLHTGDLGRIDADGYLMISGRLKDTIVRGGENISPATIEQALVSHPSVTDVCVLGREHHDLGEVPVAYVSVSGQASTTIIADLKNWAESALSRPFVPEDIHILDELPVTPVGKIDRKSLANLDRLRTAVEN